VLDTFSVVTDASSARMRATVCRCLCHGNGKIFETGGCETRTGASRQTKARWPVDVSRRAQAGARKR
jgi:hypothetical protein